MQTSSQEANQKANQKAEPTPLELRVQELQRQVDESKNEKAASLAAAGQVAEEKKQSELLRQKQELKAASDVSTILDKIEKDADDVSNRGKTVEDLTNAQMISVMTDSLEKALNARDQLAKADMSKNNDSVKNSIDGIKGILRDMHAAQTVNAARSKHSDFDDKKALILKEMDRTPGLQPEDAYILATAREAGKVPGKKNTETEKPKDNPNTERHKLARERQEHDPNIGVLGFRDLVGDAVDKVIAESDFPE